MTRTLLYYPSIDIVNLQWIKNSILYWDCIGSIVPRNLEEKYRESKYIKILNEEGLYKPFYPDDHLEDDQMPVLSQEFLDRHKFIIAKRLFEPSPQPEGVYHVYEGKVPRDIREYLLEKGYALQNRGWLILSRRDGLLFMSLLAKYLAAQNKEMSVTPGTDHIEYQDLAFRAVNSQTSNPSTQITLRNLLPMPAGAASLQEVIKFKRKREVELYNFRKVIDTYHDKLLNAADSKQTREIIRGFTEEMSIELKKIKRLFDEHKVPIMLGAVKTIIGIEVPALIVLLSSLDSNFPLWLKFFAAGSAGAISLRKYQLDVRNKLNELTADKAYSYIYYAEKEGIIRRQQKDPILDLLR
ncbi:MAG TPA: DUF6236 family protein [Anaerolineales bacterium]|nr:DUF6236 family protein [Anaerolineales bacterium]